LNFNEIFSRLNFLSWQFWLSLYLIINIFATFAPSKQDYKNIILGLVVYILTSVMIIQLDGFNLWMANVLAIVAVLLVVMNIISYIAVKVLKI